MIHVCQIVLCVLLTLVCRLLVPIGGFFKVLIKNVTEVVVDTHIELGYSVSLLCCFLEEFKGLMAIFGFAIAFVVLPGQPVLRVPILCAGGRRDIRSGYEYTNH